MKIVALVKSRENVCCRYRIAAYRPYLENAGHSLEINPWPRSLLSQLALIKSLGSADVLILQRRLIAPWQVARLRQHARFLVFDFDDSVFLRDSFSAKGLHCSRRARRFRFMVQAVDAVIAGNHFLQEQASLWTDPAKVFIIPTFLDVDRYAPQESNQLNPIKLVWIGSSSTLRGLEKFGPALNKAGRELKELSLKIICDRFLKFDELSIECCRWSEQTEAEELAQSDIGISWIPDDLWSRGKCGLKILQYMAAGLPVIANPVGLQKLLIRHGENGFLAETPDQFVKALRVLAANPDLRKQMGRVGRKLVEEKFHVALGANHWLQFLQKLCEFPKSSCRTV